MKKALLLACALVLISCFANAQQYKWLVGGGGSVDFTGRSFDREHVENLVADANGNAYAATTLGDTYMNVDTFVHSVGPNGSLSNAQVFLASYNCSGRLRWGKLITGYSGGRPWDLLYDGSDGIYLTGFVSTGGPRIYFWYDTVVNSSYYNAFLVKYDTSGKMKWLRFFGTNSSQNLGLNFTSANLALDGQSNVHLFATTHSGMQLPNATSALASSYDLKYNSSGTMLSVSRLALDSPWEIGRAVINKNSGATYIQSTYDDYISGFTTAISCFKNNALVWTDTVHQNSAVVDLAYDGNNAIYVSALSQGNPFTLGGIPVSNTTYTACGKKVGAIIKLDTNGIGKWVYKLDGTCQIGFAQVCVMTNGNVAACGSFLATVRHGNDSITAPQSEALNPIVTILDSSGALVKLDQLRSDGFTDEATAIATDRNGNLFIGGYVEDTIRNANGQYFVKTGGNTDFYVTKYGYACNCVAPVANYTSGAATGKTVSYTYNGTTSALDSLVWNWGDGQKQKVTTSFTAPVSHTFTANGKFNVCVTAYTQCGTNSYCKQTPLSVSGLEALGNVKVYPNPAKDYLSIEGAAGGTVTILSLVGQRIFSSPVTSDEQSISITALPAGAYLLRITSKDGINGVMHFVKE